MHQKLTGLRLAAATVTRSEAERAVETLIRYVGENPARQELLQTPARFVRAFDEMFSGYKDDAAEILGTSFEKPDNYSDAVILRHIDYVSHCEHHIMPFTGRAHIAYLPSDRVAGISKLARLVDMYAKRLQSQEKLTAEIAAAIQEHLRPQGVLVLAEAAHECMTLRGAMKKDVSMITMQALGIYETDIKKREEVLALLRA